MVKDGYTCYTLGVIITVVALAAYAALMLGIGLAGLAYRRGLTGSWWLLAGAAGRILAAFAGGSHALWAVAAGAALSGWKAAHGWSGLKQALDPSFFSFPLSRDFSADDLALLLLIVGSTYLVGPDMLSRLLCSRTERGARRGIVFSLAVIVPLAFLIALIGIEARALFPQAAPESAFPILMKQALPLWLGAAAMLALLSAFLSSADTTLLTLAIVVGVDLLGLASGRVEERKALKALRGITILAGASSLAVGLASGGIIPSLLLSYAVFSGGLFLPILTGLLGRPMSSPAALAAALAGGGLALAGRLLGRDIVVGAGFAVSLIVLLADRLTRRR